MVALNSALAQSVSPPATMSEVLAYSISNTEEPSTTISPETPSSITE
ncbi:MAG: hypothetical protein ACI82F_004412 [Planctomycetota bacterium]|jgi:hypothetical protein